EIPAAEHGDVSDLRGDGEERVAERRHGGAEGSAPAALGPHSRSRPRAGQRAPGQVPGFTSDGASQRARFSTYARVCSSAVGFSFSPDPGFSVTKDGAPTAGFQL